MEKEQERFIHNIDHGADSTYRQRIDKDSTHETIGYRQPLCQKLRENRRFRAKFTYSIVQCFSYMLLGWMKAQIGPSFADILRIADASLEQGGIIRTVYYVGVVLGCLACAVLFLRIPTPLLSAAIFAVASVDIAAIPWCSNFTAMTITHFIQGWCFGIYDTITFAEAVRIWKNHSKSYMQVVAFGFSLASVLSPLASAPFLTEKKYQSMPSSNFTQQDISNMSYETNSSVHTQLTLEHDQIWVEIEPETSNFYIAYTITASLTSIACVLLFTVWILYRDQFRIEYTNETKTTEADESVKEQSHDQLENKPTLTPKRKVLNLILMSVLFGVYTSVDYTFTDYLTLYCVRQLYWSTQDGAFLTSIVFVASVTSRFSAIFLVRVLRLDIYMGILLCILIGSLIGMVFIAHTMWSPGMWVCCAFIGVATGPIPGALVSWTNESFVPVTGKVSSALLVSAFIGATINPPILSHLFSEAAVWFTYLFTIESILTFLIFIFAFILSRSSKSS